MNLGGESQIPDKGDKATMIWTRESPEFFMNLCNSSVTQRDNISTHLPSTFTDKVILAPFFTLLLVNLSRNLGGISCSRESENHIIDGTWWHLLCEFRLLKNSWGVCYHLLWLLLPVSDGSSFSSGSVTQREQTNWQNYISAHELKKKKLF